VFAAVLVLAGCSDPAQGLIRKVAARVTNAPWHEQHGWNATDFFADPQVIALCDAIAADDVARMKELIAAGADVNARGKGNMTPLLWAFVDNKPERFRLLLEAGANPNVDIESDFGIRQAFGPGESVPPARRITPANLSTLTENVRRRVVRRFRSFKRGALNRSRALHARRAFSALGRTHRSMASVARTCPCAARACAPMTRNSTSSLRNPFRIATQCGFIERRSNQGPGLFRHLPAKSDPLGGREVRIVGSRFGLADSTDPDRPRRPIGSGGVGLVFVAIRR
jgi:hypothetical protein